MTAITVRNLWKEYGDRIILERVNLDIVSGAFVALVGPSGCGKSTFLRMLMGQERPTKGHILLDGQDLPCEPDADRGVVFQRYSVFQHLTVLENVLLPFELEQSRWIGRLFGAAKQRARAKAMDLLEGVGLAQHCSQYPNALSGGMQQRLALVQAVARQPKILLLDEPFGALDPGTRLSMHELMRGIWAESGMTVLMVTHDLKEAFTLGTRVIAFDRVRRDPHAPERYGATATYDLIPDRLSQMERGVVAHSCMSSVSAR